MTESGVPAKAGKKPVPWQVRAKGEGMNGLSRNRNGTQLPGRNEWMKEMGGRTTEVRGSRQRGREICEPRNTIDQLPGGVNRLAFMSERSSRRSGDIMVVPLFSRHQTDVFLHQLHEDD